jgi:hypothetical protein
VCTYNHTWLWYVARASPICSACPTAHRASLRPLPSPSNYDSASFSSLSPSIPPIILLSRYTPFQAYSAPTYAVGSPLTCSRALLSAASSPAQRALISWFADSPEPLPPPPAAAAVSAAAGSGGKGRSDGSAAALSIAFHSAVRSAEPASPSRGGGARAAPAPRAAARDVARLLRALEIVPAQLPPAAAAAAVSASVSPTAGRAVADALAAPPAAHAAQRGRADGGVGLSEAEFVAAMGAVAAAAGMSASELVRRPHALGWRDMALV